MNAPFFFFSISDAETNFYESWSPFPFPLPPKKHTCTQWGLYCTFLPLPQTDWPVNTFLTPHSTGNSHDTCPFAHTPACFYRMGPKPHCSPRSLLLGASHTLRTSSALFHSYHHTGFWPFSLSPLGLAYLPPFWGLARWHVSASLVGSFSI